MVGFLFWGLQKAGNRFTVIGADKVILVGKVAMVCYDIG